MNSSEQLRFNHLYQQHLTNLTLQGKRPATIDAYSRAVRRIAAFFDCCPDNLTTQDLKAYFAQLIASHSWSTVKLDRNGLQFFYRYVLNNVLTVCATPIHSVTLNWNDYQSWGSVEHHKKLTPFVMRISKEDMIILNIFNA
ncbi:hypothetical protein PA25_16040 [Pseudoalteromonas sp. A25]|uniref:site-specific integrase n=1 Tax=Pseudoalteromonas sp. A25 TaxID=116092 RepID=UPI0012607878|nr:site-specific integrase [Pseudoalteromonas sp. A25]BBN81619.1 hypothetical protein PA25_16040 [Pseudoalteromonas sp. A25]